MSRKEVREALFSDLSSSAILDLLGPVSSTNRRVYSGWPQEQPILTGHEPAEGWLVFHEGTTPIAFQSLREDFTYEINIFATLHTIGEDILDVLDDTWHHKLAGHNSRRFGSDRNVLWSQRVTSLDLYEETVKLYRKQATYLFATVKVPFRSGA
jgi:hypothetical protein